MQVRVVAAEGEMQGGSRIVDLHNGLYEVLYTAPATGAFLVHVEYADAGPNPVPVGIRGSPFAVECTDPWTKYRVLGALPARRQVTLDPSSCWTSRLMSAMWQLSSHSGIWVCRKTVPSCLLASITLAVREQHG